MSKFLNFMAWGFLGFGFCFFIVGSFTDDNELLLEAVCDIGLSIVVRQLKQEYFKT